MNWNAASDAGTSLKVGLAGGRLTCCMYQMSTALNDRSTLLVPSSSFTTSCPPEPNSPSLLTVCRISGDSAIPYPPTGSPQKPPKLLSAGGPTRGPPPVNSENETQMTFAPVLLR